MAKWGISACVLIGTQKQDPSSAPDKFQLMNTPRPNTSISVSTNKNITGNFLGSNKEVAAS
jgi:hypothetical protein